MALVVETGAGLGNAEAYADASAYVAWATAYNGAAPTATTAEIEAAIRRAVAYMNGLNWIGIPAQGRLQSLSWPRGFAVDRDGYGIGGDVVPREVIEAQHMFTAAEIATPNALSPSIVTKDQKVLVEVKGIRWQPLAGGASAEAARVIVLAAMDRLKGLIGPTGAVMMERA